MNFFIDASAPEGEWVCDCCNDQCGTENIAVQDCSFTDWGLYCTNCASKYRKGDMISGLSITASFKKGEEIKLVSDE